MKEIAIGLTSVEMKDSAEMKCPTQTSHEPPSDLQSKTPEAPGENSGSVSVSNSRKVTREDIEVVQNLIERCLQLYMSRNEVVNTLLDRARIEPSFTTLVWQKLEEENADFFKAYYMRLILKRQIIQFNQLLEHQYHVMQYPTLLKVPMAPIPGGIQHMPGNNLPMGFSGMQHAPILSTDNPQIDSVGSVSSSHLANGVSASSNFDHAQIKSVKEDRNAVETVPAPPVVKLEMAYSPASVASDGQFPFTPSEVSELTVDTSALDAAYKTNMTTSEGLHLRTDCGTDNSEDPLDPFSQIPWNFSFPDLAADLVNVEDHAQLEDYSGSDILLDSPEQNDIVNEFFVDNVPGPGSEAEENTEA